MEGDPWESLGDSGSCPNSFHQTLVYDSEGLGPSSGPNTQQLGNLRCVIEPICALLYSSVKQTNTNCIECS